MACEMWSSQKRGVQRKKALGISLRGAPPVSGSPTFRTPQDRSLVPRQTSASTSMRPSGVSTQPLQRPNWSKRVASITRRVLAQGGLIGPFDRPWTPGASGLAWSWGWLPWMQAPAGATVSSVQGFIAASPAAAGSAPPSTAVTTPTGNSWGATRVRATTSAASSSVPPAAALAITV